MSTYLEQVLKASGGAAAPVENLEEELPEGYHRMPDGTIMEDSAHEDEAALEKESDDPCWEGYVQLGMKMKKGKMVPNCVPIGAAQNFEAVQSVISSDDIEEVLGMYNSAVGGHRQVALSAAAEVAARSFVSYKDAYENEELTEAVQIGRAHV